MASVSSHSVHGEVVDSESCNVDNEEVRNETHPSESRDRKQTEKYAEWQFETNKQKFKQAVSAWRKSANSLERLISDSTDPGVLRKERDILDERLGNANACFDVLKQRADNLTLAECAGIFDSLEQDHYTLCKQIAKCIRSLEGDKSETRSSKSSKARSSRASSRSRDHVVAATEVAALTAKIKFMDVETQKKVELEQKRSELEKTQTLKELNIAKARLSAIEELETDDRADSINPINLPITDKNSYVAQYVQNIQESVPCLDNVLSRNVTSLPMHSFQSQLNANANAFNPIVNFAPQCSNDISDSQVKTPIAPGVEVDHSEKATNNPTSPSGEIQDVVKIITEQVSLSRLPPPEPGIFYGEPLNYPAWINAFDTLISGRGVAPKERIYYLKKYLGGSARTAVEGYLLLTTDRAYEEAKALLDERFGNPFAIANAFRERLDTWQKIHPRDGIALMRYSDFLKQCRLAMTTNTSLRVLDDDQENKKMLMKLPDWLTLRWGRIVATWRDEHKLFPPFTEFVEFIAKEAKIACDPVTSIQSLRPISKQGDDKQNYRYEKRRQAGHRSYATEVKTTTSHIQKTFIKTCLFCKKSHATDECRTFLSKDLNDRKDFIRRNGLCFGCLDHGHRSKDCKQRLKCCTCFKSHPTALHGDMLKTSSPSNEDTVPKSAVSHVGTMKKDNNTCKCSMIIPVWLSHEDRPEKEILIYTLLDTQSDTSFILDDTCEALGVSGPDVNLLLSTMTAENQAVESRKIRGLMVRGHNSSLKIPLPVTYSRTLMPSNRTHIPTPDKARRWPHLQKIADELMPLADVDVGLLIGYNCSRALAPREVIAAVGDEPYAQRTDLGWGIVGIVHQEDNFDDPIGLSHRILTYENTTHCNSNKETLGQVQISMQTQIKEVFTPVQVTKMMERDFSEHSSEERGPSYDDLLFLKTMKTGIHRTDDQHYEMPLPLRNPDQRLPNNKTIALRRFRHLESRFKRDERYKLDYADFMQNIIDSGYAELVPQNESEDETGHTWYIPHHGVYHPKKPSKIRVVFDCSASYKGESLNDCLLQGPDLTNKLIGVLCRFRQETVAFICDIEQMFFQFRVNPAQRDLLRFLWWKPGVIGGEPVEYRMKVHLFGAASSPACANFGLKQVAEDFQDEFGKDVADFVRNDFYVDDGLKSVASVEKAVGLIQKSQAMCKKGGLRLHKIVSNVRDVISAIPIEDRAKGIQDIDLTQDDLPIERALGVCWCIESDVFSFRITLQDRPLTRRGILSLISSIYDPLGFLAPVLLLGKQILQQLCKDKFDWDTKLPDDLRKRFEQWRNSLFLLETLKVPRCVKPPKFEDVKCAEMHHFSDASTSGYGQCSYLRLVDIHDRVHCSLLMGKARVTPLKNVTIPRLELTAALVSVRVSAFLKRELDYKTITDVYWTDSKIVLGYLNNDSRRFHVFVCNRVQQIRDQTKPNQWHYVRTDQNPADDGSRGLCVQDFISNSTWLKGPEFLWQKTIPTATTPCDAFELQSDDPEVKQIKIHATQTALKYATFVERLERFSNWHSAKRATALCLRLVSKSSRGTCSNYRTCDVGELSKAETYIIRLLQESEFKEELEILKRAKSDPNISPSKTSRLYRIDPFLDEDGLIRVGGRVRRSNCDTNLKHPLILPKRHHLTELIIRHYHEKVHHQGRGITINEIRSNGYWIIGCGSQVSYYISRCIKCRKFRSKAQVQKMADLPEDRVNSSPPFTFCAMDCFGPFYIKEGRKELKRYGVIYTCMASRAVHVETVNSMATDSFINSLRRFMAVRGPIRQLRSDQGSNFVGASNELKRASSDMDNDRIRNFLLPLDCDYFLFKMNVPAASHMGGAWERQIRTIRNVLTSLLDQCGSQLDDETLRTLMCEATAIVNSRPLTTDNINDINSPEPLTPNHLLTMKTRVLLPPPGNFVREDVYSRRRWRRVQHIANEFWYRWKREFMQNLQTRQKWNQPRRNIQTDDIVILMDDNSPRNQWQLARVVEAPRDRDGQVRTVKLCMADKHRNEAGKRVLPVSYISRPMHKLVLLVEQEQLV